MGQTIALTETNTRTFGNLTLHANRTVDGGYALNVWAGMERIPALGITTADRNTFRNRYRTVAESALAGVKPEVIAEQIHHAERAVIAAANEAVNTSPYAGTPPMPQPTPSTPFPVPYPGGPRTAPLAGLAATFAPHRRETRPTKTGDQSISPALRGLLRIGATRTTGIINRGQGEASIVQLQALDRRGLADLIRSGRHIIGGRLTALGRREARTAVTR